MDFGDVSIRSCYQVEAKFQTEQLTLDYIELKSVRSILLKNFCLIHCNTAGGNIADTHFLFSLSHITLSHRTVK